ncbi:MAG: YqjD family protein [Thermoanaerobaculia bacterium]
MADRIDPDSPEGADLTRETSDSGVASARQRFQKLGDEFQGRYKKVSDDVRRGAERASDEIRKGADRAKETVEDVSRNARRSYDRVRSEAGNLSRDVSLYVRDNPGKSVLIAAGVGFLLGLVARRRGGQYEED